MHEVLPVGAGKRHIAFNMALLERKAIFAWPMRVLRRAKVKLTLHWGVQQMLRGASCFSALRGRATEIIYFFFDALLHSQLGTPKRFSGTCRTRIFLGNRKSSCLRAACWQGKRGPLHFHIYG
ncbi:hypothetical protein TRVL_06806 [Trypanosoma vivax]|nr:hypothetical protein TRVL_06806 [Trypanosoma vivax]